MGLFPVCLLKESWGFAARVPASVMHHMGLGDLVAHNKRDFSQLLRHWSDPGQRQELLRVAREIRSEFHNQIGFWKPGRPADEILNAFRKLAEMEPGDKLKMLDARLAEYAPSPSRFPVNNAAWKSLIPLDVHAAVESAMEKIEARKKFKPNQMNHVRVILMYLIELHFYPLDVIGCGGFCIAVSVRDHQGILNVLKLEYHQVYPSVNMHNCEMMRSAFAEHELARRSRNGQAVKAAQVPGTVKFVLGHTQADEKGLSVVFSLREHLGETFHDSVKELFATWRETGELGDGVRVSFLIATFGLAQLNDLQISLLDVSPNNLYIYNGTLRITDMGCAGVFEFRPDQEYRQPEFADRSRTSFADADLREVQAAGKAHGAKSKKPKLFYSGQVAQFWQSFTERRKSVGILRKGTAPFRVEVDSHPVGALLNAAVGAYIDRCGLARLLLWYLAPVWRDEDSSAWEREVQAIDSAAGLNAFIVKRMREPLREDHPRQPLMWERLLDFILKGLKPFVSISRGEQDTNTQLSDLAVHRFLAMPFLDACDDRALQAGGSIVVAGGDLYGSRIPNQLKSKRTKQTLLRLSPGKGLGVFAGEDMFRDEIAGIYLCSRVIRSDGVESRFTVSCIGSGEELYIYEARFTSKMTVRWYTDEKRSCGPFVNGACALLEVSVSANCKLDRALSWDDDQEKDQGRALRIFPLIVTVEKINKGEELFWKYNPFAGRGRTFPRGF